MTRHSYRRALALLVLVLITVALLAACRGPKPQTETPPATTGVVPTAATTASSAVVIKP